MKFSTTTIVIFICTFALLCVYLYYCEKKREYFESRDFKLNFLTFGTKDSFTKSLLRIKDEAAKMEIFDDIRTLNEDDLMKHTDFWNKNKQFIELNKRGYGYWIWKPYLILHALKNMQDGDILVYCDCGSTIQTSGKSRMLEYIDDCKKSKTGIYCFNLIYDEKEWTKMDLFVKLDMNKEEWLNSKQIMATDMLVKKCPESIELLEKWYELCMENNYHYLTDSPSVQKNDASFSEHRHDQSIFSLLVKKTGGCFIQKISEPEIKDPKHPIYNSRIRDGPRLH